MAWESARDIMKAYRKATGYTMVQIAEKFKVSQPYISNISNGKKRIPDKMLPDVARLLNSSPNLILAVSLRDLTNSEAVKIC